MFVFFLGGRGEITVKEYERRRRYNKFVRTKPSGLLFRETFGIGATPRRTTSDIN